MRWIVTTQAKEGTVAGHKVFSFEEKMLWVVTVVLVIPVFYEHCSLPPMLHCPSWCFSSVPSWCVVGEGAATCILKEWCWFERSFLTLKVADMLRSAGSALVRNPSLWQFSKIAVRQVLTVCAHWNRPGTRQRDGKANTCGSLPALCLWINWYIVHVVS